MGTAHLNVWLADREHPCRIDDAYVENEDADNESGERFFHVLHCDGSILSWCGEKYFSLPMKCGHAEVEVPPGCYMVCANHGRGHAEGDRPISLGNKISHIAFVRVNCGDHACVTLFQPTLPHCGHWFRIALQEHVAEGRVDRRAGDQALQALDRVLDTLPMDDFTKRMVELAEQAR